MIKPTEWMSIPDHPEHLTGTDNLNAGVVLPRFANFRPGPLI